MGVASENLKPIVEKMNTMDKVNAVFYTNIAGADVNWDMTFQFNLNNEEPFHIQVKDRKASLLSGTASDPDIMLTGDNNAIVKICNGKGDFTHAISREEITVTKGKVIEVIRLTRAINLVLGKK
ncbi:MAG: SCP2 sterol-binding domain-containing protein [Promethearchaeota archaeon]